MKNLKKILALVLVIALTATATVGITLALLTDETEIKHNVFTAGNVEISLTEKVDGDTYGGVDTTPDGAEYKLVAPGDELTKEVTVKNEGSLPAYVAVTVTMNNAKEINEAIDGYYEALGYSEQKIQGIYDHIFEGWGLNHTKTDAAGDATGMRLTITGDDMPEHTLQVDSVKTLDEYWLAYSKNWFANASDATAVIPFDGYYTAGMDAYEIKWTYYLELQPGEESTLFTGINVPEYFKNEQMAMFDGLEIDIQGAAIQAENFANAKAAFAALKEEQGAPVEVFTAEDLKDALTDGKDVTLFDDIELTDGESLVTPAGSDVTVDLNGHKLANPVKAAPALINNGKMTITGGTVVNENIEAQRAAAIVNYGELTLNDVNVGSDLNRGAAVQNEGGKVVVNGGRYETMSRAHPSNGYAYVFINNSGEMEINGATTDGWVNGVFYATTGTITVNSGSYTIKPGGNTWHVAYAESGASVKLNGGTYVWNALYTNVALVGDVVVDPACNINW